jgi:outer membrane protein assembly factor BamB
VAFDRTRGDVVWKALDDTGSYSSPIGIDQGGERQAVFLTGKGVVSVGPTNGRVFWEYPLKDALLESSTTPIRAGDLLLASSITFGSVGLHLETREGKPAIKEQWKNPALTSYFSTPVAVGDHVYIVAGKNPLSMMNPLKKAKPEATLHCVEAATGKVLWSKAPIGTYHASLMRTGNNKLILLTDGGALALLEPDPTAYRELARSRVSGPETWAHPAMSNGLLIIRDNKAVICLQPGS